MYEKISLFDFLTIVLPGGMLTLAASFIINGTDISWVNTDLNEFYTFIIVLSSSLFLGTFINYLTEIMLPVIRIFGLYKPIAKIYGNLQSITTFGEFYDKMFDEAALKLKLKSNREPTFHQKVEYVWNQIYFYLEVNDKNSVPKAHQSYYFFFRNFFTAGLIMLITFIVLIFVSDQSTQFIHYSIMDLCTIILCILAGSWHRKRMVLRMFWNYYALKNEA